MVYKEGELNKVVEYFLKEAEGLNLVGLSGNLGAGKTTFVKALLKILGVTQNVVSPTFVLRRDYEVQSPPPTPPHKGGEKVRPHLTGNLKNIHNLKMRALELRKEMTPAEEYLWTFLRNGQLGSKFRRQHVFDNFIVDFINLEYGLIVEVDGEVHDFQKERDNERTQIFESIGYRVIRFKNEEVLNNINFVISEIKGALAPSLVGRVGERTNKEGVTKIIHIDAYRLEKPEQIYQVVSREEVADKNNLVLVEWPELSENIFQKIFLFEHVDEDRRKISIKSV